MTDDPQVDHEDAQEPVPDALPDTLHARLALLAYDRRRRRFDGSRRPRYGLALRAAMLTDLHLSGHVRDDAGAPQATDSDPPTDPLLLQLFHQVGEYSDWEAAVLHDSHAVAPAAVREHLRRAGWFRVTKRRTWTLRTATVVDLANDALVRGLARQTIAAVESAVTGGTPDQRLLAVGLIGALGGLPTVVSFDDAQRHHAWLEYLVATSVPPITAMLEIIEQARQQSRADWESSQFKFT